MVLIEVSDAQAAEIAWALQFSMGASQIEDESAMFYIANLIEAGRKAIRTREAGWELK